MPIKNYGVWVAKPTRVTAERAEQDDKSPHIHLFYDDSPGGNSDNTRRASINVKSLSQLSELVFWLSPNFKHPILETLQRLEHGFHNIDSLPGGIALDYIRGNLMEFKEGRILPHDLPAERDDVIDFVMPELQAAINRNATIYLFGEPFNDKQGIHNIHMNQGSQGRFRKSNGIWQDGGIIMHFSEENRFAAIFLAFASQAVHTDEKEGHALPNSQNFAQLLGQEPVGEEKTTDDRRVAIVAALVNPVGDENQPNATAQPELVYLLNRSMKTHTSLSGWSLLNKNDEAHRISEDITLAPGAVQSVSLGNVPLSNRGGLISLLDDQGIKVDGVIYTREQSKMEGQLVIFR